MLMGPRIQHVATQQVIELGIDVAQEAAAFITLSGIQEQVGELILLDNASFANPPLTVDHDATPAILFAMIEQIKKHIVALLRTESSNGELPSVEHSSGELSSGELSSGDDRESPLTPGLDLTHSELLNSIRLDFLDDGLSVAFEVNAVVVAPWPPPPSTPSASPSSTPSTFSICSNIQKVFDHNCCPVSLNVSICEQIQETYFNNECCT